MGYGISDIIHSGELYDYVNQFAFDFPFYKKWCEAVSGNVLELCCGTGRLTIPLAQEKIDITGLDISASMLERARLKAKESSLDIEFIQGDIINFSLDKKFDLIFIPFNSFQCIYSIEDVEKVFSCVQNHMAKKGIFILDIFNPSIDFMVTRKDSWHLAKEFTMENGDKVTIEEKCEYDSAGQVNRVKWKHTIAGKESIAQLDMRCFYPLEMDALLKYNGFEVAHKFGDFEEHPFEAKSMKQIYICKCQ